MKFAVPSLLAAVLFATLSGCADSDHVHDHADDASDGHDHADDSDDSDDPFADAAAGRVAVTDGAGAFRVAYVPNPDPLVQGPFALTLTVRVAADGSVKDGIVVDADAWMPEHGHGMIGASPETIDQGGGTFVANGMDFIMGGSWEMLIDVTDGDVTETAHFAVDVP